MSREVVLLVAGTALLIAAVLLIVTPPPAHVRSTRRADRADAIVAAWGVGAAVVVVATSGWIVPAVVVGAATGLAVRRWQRRDRRDDAVDRTDALASWIESLRDVLLAGDQPIGAIAATAPTAGPSIRPAVRRLATALDHQEPDLAFRRFADDVDDPLGDLVAAGLLIAVHRGARTAEVLGALADQARTQADRRRVVEAERAPLRREVTLLTAIMGGLLGVLLVFGRAEYLAPYDSAGGQAFLAIVLGIYAALLLRVQRLARFPRPARFLTASAGAPGRVAPRLEQSASDDRRRDVVAARSTS